MAGIMKLPKWPRWDDDKPLQAMYRDLCLATTIATVAFTAGVQTHAWFRGSVWLSHNVKIEGDPLNRGQTYIEVEFPHGLRLWQVRLPDGSIFPDRSKPRWIKIVDGKEADWLDRLTFETAEVER